jgi:drug/metabolite transporter (DMT)-like permease
MAGTYLLVVGIKSVSVNIGDLIILMTALLVGFTNAYAKIPMKTVTGGSVAHVRLVVGMLVLIVITPFISPTLIERFSSISLWYVLSGVLMWGVIVSFYKAIEQAGASIASLILVSYPLFVAIGSILILKETLSVEQMMGGLIICVSIYNISRPNKA